MDFQRLKHRLSPKNISKSIQSVLMRFPVSAAFLFLLTVLLSCLVITETDPKEGLLCLLAFLSGGTVISLTASLWGEEQTKRKRWIAEGIALALYGIYCVLLFLTDIIPNRGLPAFWLGNLAWMAAVIVWIPFCSFLREKEDLKAWHFILSLCAALIISGIVSWVMIGGLEGLVVGTAILFDLISNRKLCTIILIVGSVLLFGILFLALIPAGERKHNNAAETPPLLTKVVSWLLIPLLACYIVVLYVYGITILVQWELPKGMISGLVSAVMGGYMLCYLLLYPLVLNKQTWQSKVLTFWLPVVILPLLILMTVGVVRRFMDYGLTPPRLYLLTLLLWFYAVCIIMLAVPRKRFRWIFLSLAALFLLSSGHPLNYYRLCRPVLTAKIDKIIEENNLQTPFKLYNLPDSLANIDVQDFQKELRYMQTCYGKDFTSRWIENGVNQTMTKKEEKQIVADVVKYNKLPSEYLSPQGYSIFRWTTRYESNRISRDSLYDGIVHDAFGDVVWLFDTAAIRRANAQGELMLLHSQNGQKAFAPSSITITFYNDSTIDLYYNGYFFSKE